MPSLSDAMAQHGNPVEMLRNSRIGMYVYPIVAAGHMIGDMIVFRERDDKFLLVGRSPAANWVKFQAAIGKWSVRVLAYNFKRVMSILGIGPLIAAMSAT